MFDPIVTVVFPFFALIAALFFAPKANERSRAAFGVGVFAMNTAASFVLLQSAAAGMLPEHTALFAGNGLFPQMRFRADTVALSFVLLNNFVGLLCMFYAGFLGFFTDRVFLLLMLLLNLAVNGAFLANDLLLFYIFFEATLLPLFLIVGIRGGKQRYFAAMKLFIFTLLGSVPMLIALGYLYVRVGSFAPADIVAAGLSHVEQGYLRAAFLLAFAVKLPLWPLHVWLPDAHTEAPTVGSVLLAAIMLKIGGYGMLRFTDTLFPDVTAAFALPVAVLSVAAIVAASATAFVQTDIKKLIAYSSVAHMGYVTLALASGGVLGRQAAMFQMISHGFVSAGLFFMIGMFYERFHTRNLADYGGLARKMPVAAAFFMLLTFANVGLPGTSGFIGEFNSLIAAFSVFPLLTVPAAFGVVMSAAYGLKLYRRMMFEAPGSVDGAAALDLKAYEVLTLTALAVPVVWFGVRSAQIMHMLEPALR